MLEQLSKLAARSASLRSAHLQKEAGMIGSAALSAAKFTGKAAVNNPGTALGVGVVGAVSPGAVKGSFQKHHAGFDPAAQKALLGETPKPPGIP